MRQGSRLAAVGSALAVFVAAAPAAGDGHLSVQVGGFVPWSGDAGVMTTVQIVGSNSSGRSRWGAEFEYREFETKIMHVKGVDVDSYLLRAIWQYHFQPDAVLTPYIGLGLGVGVNSVDDDKVDDARGFNARDSTGAGLDAMVLLGLAVNIPGAEYISLFAEGRAGLAVDFAGRGNRSGVTSENVGGASGSAGLRFRF